MKQIKKLFKNIFFSNLENYSPTKFIILSILFAIIVALLDGIIDNIFFYEHESILHSLFFNLSGFELYIRTMIIVTFTLFGTLVAFFINRIKKDNIKLQESELKFKTIAEYSKDWVYWIAPDKSINYISPSCREITGYTMEEFEHDINLLDNIIFEEDKILFLDHEHTSLKGENLLELQFRIVCKNNEIKWIHHLCQPVYKDGIYLGHRVSNRDISKLKNTEEKLITLGDKLQKSNRILKELVDQRTVEMTTFMTQCPYPRSIYDRNGNLLNSNPAWNQNFERNISVSNIFNHPVIKNSNLIDKIKKVFDNGESYKSHPIYYEEFDKMLILDLYTIKNKNNEIEKIVLNVEDITEQTKNKDLSEQLNLRKDIVSEIFDFLDAERKNISKELHDRIGQNLMLIKMNAELIKEANNYLPAKSDDIIKLAKETTKEIKEIIYSLYPEEIEKYGLKESINKLINRILKVSNINFDLEFKGEYIPFDKKKELAIYRICQESINNIIKHSKATEANFEFHFKNNLFMGIIKDNGSGFELGDNILGVSKYGLKFMQERVENLGGQIEFYSQLNKGSSIYFELSI